MENITIGQIGLAIAFIVSLIKGLDFLFDFIKKKLSKTYAENSEPIHNELTSRISANEEQLDSNNNRIRLLEESNVIILQSLLAIVSHEITGNSIEKLKVVQNDLTQFLIHR